MKTIGITALLTALVLTGCNKQTITRTDEPPAEPTEQAPAPPAPTRAPSATPAPPAIVAATPAPELAPAGVFYLLTAARVETAEGIHGLPPGTGVKLIRDNIYLTPSGEVALNPNQLTNDMALARRVRDADRARQAGVQAALSKEAEAAAEARAVAAAAAPAPAEPASRAPRTPAPRFVEGTNNQASGLQSSSALGAGHTRTKDGILWQKSPDGKYWRSVRYLRGGGAVIPPQSEKVQ